MKSLLYGSCSQESRRVHLPYYSDMSTANPSRVSGLLTMSAAALTPIESCEVYR